uniref:Uncharacterized protein n=1 Tax=viral metagenome TaxID=1070528 RepID=A0A6C0EJV2_9ZZZZ
MVFEEKFNKTLTELFDNIKSNYSYLDKSINSNYTFPLTGIQHVEKFYTYSENKEQDISTKNEMIFSENQTLIEHVDFYKLWNDETLDCDNKQEIWNYLHALYIYAYEYKNNKDVVTILDELKDIPLDSDKLDLKTKAFLNIIESLKDNDGVNGVDIGANIDDIMGDSTGDSKGGLSGIDIPEIFEGSIGKLANEIAQDINTNDLNIDDPSKLLEGLFSGNFDINNDTSGIASLVQNITSKIQNKISSGELDENDLFSEASNVMSKLGQNDMFSNIMKTMSPSPSSPSSTSPSPLASFFTPSSQSQEQPPLQIESKEKRGKTIDHKKNLQEKREYLKKKLEKKKLEEKK